jgi:ethanolamine ammonia-lyase small subunit
LPTRELLDFSQAHAQARDAVQCVFDPDPLEREIRRMGMPTLRLTSAAASRLDYLRRPDWGRRLAEESRVALQALAKEVTTPDLVLIISDGLSAQAAHLQAPALLDELLPLLRCDGWTLAPILLVKHGRVAIEDEIGELLGAQIAVILIGERPGLRAPDSLGAYLIYGPAGQATDAQRNCISNIRPEGLAPRAAAHALHYLLRESRNRKLSGVALKDERGTISGTNGPSLEVRPP